MWHLFPIQVPTKFRESLFKHLRSNGVGVQVNYLPAYKHPVFKARSIDNKLFPNSELFYSKQISLPMHTELTEEEIARINKIIAQFFEANSRNI